jgi:hypothetical protein
MEEYKKKLSVLLRLFKAGHITEEEFELLLLPPKIETTGILKDSTLTPEEGKKIWDNLNKDKNWTLCDETGAPLNKCTERCFCDGSCKEEKETVDNFMNQNRDYE